MNGRFFVGEWLVEPEQNRIVRGEERVKLDPKAVQVLSFLAEHPREILTKEQIIDSVWNGAFVSDEVLTTAVWGLRKAFGDDAKEPRYIKTVPRQGYRLIAPVERASAESARAWEPSPYPGLSAFGSRDAEFFFGREEQVDSLWGKLQRNHLLGLIGPSGAGKSSLLKAGLIPSCPEGWNAVLLKPRGNPFSSLATALGVELSEQPLEALMRWRGNHREALLTVDQFEELFTLSEPETQTRFAALLGAAAEAGVHVLLSIRDDFLIRCHDHRELAPVFRDLTPIKALEGAALGKALVEPARACGYRFEDEALVAVILAEVTKELGALPLLAFAASRLWEKRDRERRLLTRQAYVSIGGVSGALAQHAEKTLEFIGGECQPIVREIFRNLTTAWGTRVPTGREELLSVFRDRGRAEEVLAKLVDARLLTSGEGGIEIIHESLLTAWPRLVRWQAQDAEGAVLRDQLRQSARLWEERGRADDLLWTGTAFRDFAIWRERYPGALSKTEEAFAEAATKATGRKRRQRRIAFASILAASLVVTAVTFSLWRHSESQTLRAEASKLLALGQLEMERNPTGALAYALKSLELADTEEARLFALRLLQTGPTSIDTPADEREGLESFSLAFSADGEWAAFGGLRGIQLRHRDGRDPIVLQGEYPTAGLHAPEVGFAPDARLLASNRGGDLRVWSVPDAREIWKAKLEEGPSRLFVRENRIFTSTTVEGRQILRWSPFEKPESRLIGSMEPLRVDNAYPVGGLDVNRSGTTLAYALGRSVYVRSLEDWSHTPVLVAEHSAEILGVAFDPSGKRLAVSDASGEIRIWATTEQANRPLRVLDAANPADLLSFSPDGSWLATAGASRGVRVVRDVRQWDLTSPPGTLPFEVHATLAFAFEPTGRWLVTTHSESVSFWPLEESYARVLEEPGVPDVAFAADGTALLSASSDRLRVLPLDQKSGSEPRVLARGLTYVPRIALDSSGRNVVAPSARGDILVVPIDGGPARELEGFSSGVTVIAVATSPDGRRMAAAPLASSMEKKAIKVWNVDSGAAQVELPVPGAGEGEQGGILHLFFVDRDRLLAGGYSGLMLFDLKDGSRKDLLRSQVLCFAFSRKGRFGFAGTEGSLVRFGMDEGASTTVPDPGGASGIAFNDDETLMATAGSDGIVRVMPLSGGEPHLLLGHKGVVRTVAFSPDGRWLASGSHDGTIRLWPVPDVTETPLHKRRREELLSTLRARTNVRAVESQTGWKLEVGPFPGWAKLPTLN